jgi:hypothetical protein
MKCGNCKFFHKLKYGFEVERGFKESSCCIALTRLDEKKDDYECFVIETTEDDTCEMFTDKCELTKC